MTSPAEPSALPRVTVPTVEGPAAVRVVRPRGDAPGSSPAGTLLLGHGAGGQRDAADVLALTALADEGWTVVLVDQPWRVAGRRVASPPATLDRAWADLTALLATQAWQEEHGLPLPGPWVHGGRSAGARVACRAAVDEQGHPAAGVAGVLCLAFPLHPPGRPERSRAGELAGPLAAGLPTLVVQGARDPMGTPEELLAAVPQVQPSLRTVPGNHSPSRDLAAVVGHTARFLEGLATPHASLGDAPDPDDRTPAP